MKSRDGKCSRTGQPVVFSMPDAECIWSKAGVIEFTECVNAFDCTRCPVERRARATFENKSEAGGDAARMGLKRILSMPNGKCRHMMSGRIDYGLCSSGDCASCPVEQMIEDSCHLPESRRSGRANVAGFEAARNYYYHRGHTWARVEYGGWVRVGLDDFALRLLGPQDAIELPPLGSTLRQGSPAAVLRRFDREVAIASPVEGRVVAVNHKVLENAPVANDAPYDDGWFMLIEPTNIQVSLRELLFDAEGLSWIDGEAMSLNALLAEESRLSLVAAGSETARDYLTEAPELGWDRLVQDFLAE